MRSKSLLLPALSGLTLASCASTPAPSPVDLTKHSWNLFQIAAANAPPMAVPAEQQSTHQLKFSSDGTLALQLDCNRGNASWSIAQPSDATGSIKIGVIASTRMLCPSPSFGEAMAADLSSADTFTIAQDGKSLSIVAKGKTYSFIAGS